MTGSVGTKKRGVFVTTDELLEKKVWAVVGANTDPEKFGNRIYRRLLELGYRVYPVNPRYTEIDGAPCYATLSLLPEKPDVLNMVVAPRYAEGFLTEAASLSIRDIWFQPGTYSEEIAALCDRLSLHPVQACVLVETAGRI